MSNKRIRKANVTVVVNSNVEKAMRQLRKKMDREGVTRDMKRRVYHETPTQKRRKKYLRALKQNWIRISMSKPS